MNSHRSTSDRSIVEGLLRWWRSMAVILPPDGDGWGAVELGMIEYWRLAARQCG